MTLQRGPVVARVFKCLPGGFKEDPLLRIHPLGIPRRDVEEQRIKAVDVIDEAAPPGVDLAFQAAVAAVVLAVLPALGGDLADAVDTVLEVVPEAVDIGRAGKPPGQADDRDRLIALLPPRPRRAMPRPGGRGGPLCTCQDSQRLPAAQRMLGGEVARQRGNAPVLEEQGGRQLAERLGQALVERGDHQRGQAVAIEGLLAVDAAHGNRRDLGKLVPEIVFQRPLQRRVPHRRQCVGCTARGGRGDMAIDGRKGIRRQCHPAMVMPGDLRQAAVPGDPLAGNGCQRLAVEPLQIRFDAVRLRFSPKAAARRRMRLSTVEQPHQLVAAAGHHRQAMVQRGAAGTEGVADISQAGVVQPSRLQRLGKRRDQLVELFAARGGKGEQPGPLAWPRKRLLRRRFEDQVAAGSAGAKGIDQRAPGPPPLAQPIGDGKAARFRADHRAERVAAEGRGDLPVFQLHQHFGDLRQRRRGFEVADIGFDRSHHQRCIVAGRAAKHFADRRELSPVRQTGAGGRGLDIADRLGGQRRLLQHSTHRHGLAVGVRRPVTGGFAAMADRGRPDHTENPVAMPYGLFERPDQQCADAFAGDPPVGVAAEGMGLVIAGQQRQRGQQFKVRGVADQVDATDNRRLTLALPDAVARKMQRGHRRRTRCIDNDAGAIEIVEEGHPVGDRREKRGGPSALLRGREMLVIAPHRADKHADPPGLPPQARGSMAAVFQTVPDRLQEQALLGIQRPGLGGGDPEQQGIEQVLASQRPHRPPWRIIHGVATVEQRFSTQYADGRAARAQVPPERLGVGGARIATADPDDRHRIGIDVRIGHPGCLGRIANFQPRPVGGQRLRDGTTDKAVHQIVALVQRKGVSDLVEIHRSDGAQPDPELALLLQQQLADPSGLEQREIAALITVGRGVAGDDKDAQPRLVGVLTVERGIAAVDRCGIALADPAQAVAVGVVAVDPVRQMGAPAALRRAVLGKVQVDLRRQPGIGVIQPPVVLVGPQQAQQPAQLTQAQRPAVVLPLGGPQPQRIGADRRGRQCDDAVALRRQVTADLPLLLVQLRQFLPARQCKTVVFFFQEIGEHGAGPAPVRAQRLATPSLDRRRRALDQAMQESVARPQPEQFGDRCKVNAIGQGQRDAEVGLAGQQQVFNVARFKHQQGGGGAVVDRCDRIGFCDQEQGKARLVQLRTLSRPKDVRIQPGRYADRQQAVQPRLVIIDAAGQAIDPPFGRIEVTLDRIEAAGRGVEIPPLPVQRYLPQQRQQTTQPFEIRRRAAGRPPVGPGIEADRVQWNRLVDGLPADRRSVRWRRFHLGGRRAVGVEDMRGNRGNGRLLEEDIHR